MRKSFLALLIMSPTVAFADAHFHCYSYPGVPVQAYEYGAAECSSSSTNEKDIHSGEGEREIMCVYKAG